MPDIPVPPEAVTAAAPAVHKLMCLFCSEPSLRAEPPCHRQPDEVDQAAARFILTAAAPLIAAAERRRIGEASFSPDEDDRTGLFRLARADGVLVERERLRQLAARVDAVYPDLDAPGLTLSFADLIGDPDA